jgi:hypothetical protein
MPGPDDADKAPKGNTNVNMTTGEVRATGSKITGTTDKGEMVIIDRNQLISFAENARDWRRVRVRWNGTVVAISTTAWVHASPIVNGRRAAHL